jgi:hypothetical protein
MADGLSRCWSRGVTDSGSAGLGLWPARGPDQTTGVGGNGELVAVDSDGRPVGIDVGEVELAQLGGRQLGDQTSVVRVVRVTSGALNR